MAIAAPVLLQICPNDLAPFAQICSVYAQAAEQLGATCTTVFLDQRAATPVDPAASAGSVIYLTSAEDKLGNIRTLRRKLAASLGELQPTLSLCHRYRSYRLLRNSRFMGTTNIVLAHEYGMLLRWQRRLARLVFGQPFLFAGIAPAVAQELARITRHELVLPNALDQRELEQRLLPPEKAREALGASRWQVNAPANVIGVVGRLHRKKRPHLAMAGFSALVEEVEEVKEADAATQLVFVGDGDLRDNLAQQAAASNLAVHFCGFVPDAPSTLRGLDVLLMTSAPAEAFGMVALEALTAGIPVVAPDIPGPKSVLGELGIYFDESNDAEQQAMNIAEALAKALALKNSDSLSDWQSRASQRVADRFSISATAKRLQPWLAAEPNP